MRETIARYADDGWQMAIASNQGGVAAGHKTLESAILEMRFCLELFPQITEAFFCPDFEGQRCWRVWGSCDDRHRIFNLNEPIKAGLDPGSFRKPGAGMLKLAIDIHSPDEVLYVGDRPEDEEAAAAAGIYFLLMEEWRI